MSYERLNIQDFVDKWDVAKVQHLEDGIVANEEAIERYYNENNLIPLTKDEILEICKI